MSHDEAVHALSRRAAALAGELREIGASGLVVFAASAGDTDAAPFVGPAHLGEFMVLVTSEGQASLGHFSPLDRGEAAATGLPLFSPELLGVAEATRVSGSPAEALSLVLARALEEAGMGPSRIALAGHQSSGLVYEACRGLESTQGYEFCSGNVALAMMRKGKIPAEIEHIRESSNGVCAAFNRVAEILRESKVRGCELWWKGSQLSVGRIRKEIAGAFGDLGLDQPRGNIVAPGSEGGVPHNAGSNKRCLEEGESLVVDLYPKGQLFSDCTRTFCVGEPPEDLHRAHALVLEALEWSHQEVRIGGDAWELQEGVCKFFESKGYPTVLSTPGTEVGYVHSLGHGVGFELHELPVFRKGAGRRSVLEEGDVLTLEPGLYDEQAGYGVRVEDLCVLSADGLENLTGLPYGLDPNSW